VRLLDRDAVLQRRLRGDDLPGHAALRCARLFPGRLLAKQTAVVRLQMGYFWGKVHFFVFFWEKRLFSGFDACRTEISLLYTGKFGRLVNGGCI